RARESLMGIDVCRDRFNTRARTATDDRNRCGRGYSCLTGETLHDAIFCGIRACSSFMSQKLTRGIDLLLNVIEESHIPGFRHSAFKGESLRLKETVEAHDTQTH